MIVRCSNCSSAFAVDDTKVENKKFAFSCPKCAHENIVDNTAARMSVAANTGEKALTEGDMKEGTVAGMVNSSPHDTGAGIMEEVTGFEEREASEDDDFNISLSDDIDFSDDEESLGSDVIIDTPPGEGDDEISFNLDLDAGLPDIDLESTDTEEPAAVISGTIPEEPMGEDVLDISLDYLEEEGRDDTGEPGKDAGEAPDDFLPIEEEISPDLGEEREPEGIDIEADETLGVIEDESDEDSITVDIDSLEIELDEDLGEESGAGLDLESVDIGEISGFEIDAAETGFAEEDESITLDIDSLDIDLDESEEILTGDTPVTAESLPGLETGDEGVPEIDLGDNDIIPDLELSLEETPVDFSETGELLQEDSLEEDESITLDLEELDLDLVEEEGISEGETPEDIMELPGLLSPDLEGEDIALPEAEELSDMGLEMPADEDLRDVMDEGIDLEEDESITLDLETLDLDLAEEEGIMEGEIPDSLPGKMPEPGAEEGSIETGRFIMEEPDEDESITIDLDSLDIPLAEQEEVMEGEVATEDESLTLEDAGLTFDELTTEEMASAAGETINEEEEELSEDEDIRITIDEIDPNLDFEALESDIETEAVPGIGEEGVERDLEEDTDLLELEMGKEDRVAGKTGEDHHPEIDFGLDENEISVINGELDEIKKSIDEDDLNVEYPEVRKPGAEVDYDLFSDEDLPDIDLDETGDDLPGRAGTAGGISRVSDDVIDIDDDREYDTEAPERKSFFTVSGGNVNFSIDYSLAYSRLGAFLRLSGVFLIGLIPHFIVFIIYLALSLILGILNHIVVLTTSRPVEDFQAILEKTLRYYLSINASLLGIVEEMPVFTGNDDIDYPLQLNITYSLRSSSIMAALRLSVVGILLISLPHILILSLLTVALPAIFLIGIISVLITRRWPHYLFDFMSVYYSSVAKILAFIMGLVDRYPPFKFG